MFSISHGLLQPHLWLRPTLSLQHEPPTLNFQVSSSPAVLRVDLAFSVWPLSSDSCHLYGVCVCVFVCTSFHQIWIKMIKVETKHRPWLLKRPVSFPITESTNASSCCCSGLLYDRGNLLHTPQWVFILLFVTLHTFDAVWFNLQFCECTKDFCLTNLCDHLHVGRVSVQSTSTC